MGSPFPDDELEALLPHIADLLEQPISKAAMYDLEKLWPQLVRSLWASEPYLGDGWLAKLGRRDKDGHVGNRWGSQGPPQEAYGRITNAERYRSLHLIGRALLDELEHRFDVTREVRTEADQHGASSARVVRLVPADPAASPLTIVFDNFPGLLVRMGHNCEVGLPACGCDACDETVERCEEQLRAYAEVCAAGDFGERIVHADGWWHERWYGFPVSVSWNRAPLDLPQRDALRETFACDETRWAPWPQRAGAD